MLDSLYYDSLDLLKSLISTPRHSREESKATDLIEAQMNAWGLSPLRHANNVWAIDPEYDPSRPTILLNSHIDTVRPATGWTHNPYTPTIEDDRLYGLGSNDAGASLVSLLAAYRAMTTLPRHSNLVFAASAEEEVSGKNGLEAILHTLPPIDYAIVGEPTGMNPAVAEKGLMVLDGVARGKAGHAARDEGDNAIYRAIGAIERLRTMKFEKESETLGPVKISVTQIEAGTQHNVVPDECRFVVDVRTTDAYTNTETAAILQNAVSEFTTLTPRSTRLNASVISSGHPLARAATAMGLKPFVSPTLSDRALMHGIPALKIGPGDSARSHTANEYVFLSDITQGIDTYSTLLLKLSETIRKQ